MRRTVSVRELIIIAVIMLLSIAAFILSEFFKSDGKTAVISVNGNIITSIDLAQSENKTFNLSGIQNVTFEIKDNHIRVVASDCPDKICKNKGFISKSGESIICMPNKIIIEIKE